MNVYQMKNIFFNTLFILALFILVAVPVTTSADETSVQDSESAESSENSGETDAAGMAQKLANPLAAMISLPMQLNYDQGFGENDTGNRFLMNVQPVVPISISDDWNLMVSKLKRFNKQMVSFQGGLRYWIKSTDSGPEGLGLRFAVTLLFPK